VCGLGWRLLCKPVARCFACRPTAVGGGQRAAPSYLPGGQAEAAAALPLLAATGHADCTPFYLFLLAACTHAALVYCSATYARC